MCVVLGFLKVAMTLKASHELIKPLQEVNTLGRTLQSLSIKNI